MPSHSNYRVTKGLHRPKGKQAVWHGSQTLPPPLGVPANQNSARVYDSQLGKWLDYKLKRFPGDHLFTPEDLWNFVWFELFRDEKHFSSTNVIITYFNQAFNHEAVAGRLAPHVQWDVARATITRRIKQHSAANDFDETPPEQAPPLRVENLFKLANADREEQAMAGAMIQSGFRSGVWKKMKPSAVKPDELGEYVCVEVTDDKNIHGNRTVLLACSCIPLDELFHTGRGKFFCPRHSGFQNFLPFSENKIHDLARRLTGQHHKSCGHSFRVTWNCCFARAVGAPTLEAYDAYVRQHPLLRHNLMTQHGWSPTSPEFTKYARRYAVTHFLSQFYATQFFYILYNVILWSPRAVSLMATKHSVGRGETIQRFLGMNQAILDGPNRKGHSDMTSGTMLDQARHGCDGHSGHVEKEIMGIPIPPVLSPVDADRLVKNAAVVASKRQKLEGSNESDELTLLESAAACDQRQVEEACDRIDPSGGAKLFFVSVIERIIDPTVKLEKITALTDAIQVNGLRYPLHSLCTKLDPNKSTDVGIPEYAVGMSDEQMDEQNVPRPRFRVGDKMADDQPPDRAWDEFNLNRPPISTRQGAKERTRAQWKVIAMKAATARAQGFQLLTGPKDPRQMHTGKFRIDTTTGKYKKRDVDLKPQENWEEALLVEPIYVNLQKAEAEERKHSNKQQVDRKNLIPQNDSEVEEEDDLFH